MHGSGRSQFRVFAGGTGEARNGLDGGVREQGLELVGKKLDMPSFGTLSMCDCVVRSSGMQLGEAYGRTFK